MTPKGVVWPGMTMFDAASLAIKAVRNQKKESSVFVKMQMSSTLIQPTEVVSSPGWTMLKARNIDDLEDDISLVDGESPLVKKTTRKRRASGKTTSKNARKARANAPKKGAVQTMSKARKPRQKKIAEKPKIEMTRLYVPASEDPATQADDEQLQHKSALKPAFSHQLREFIDPRHHRLDPFDQLYRTPTNPLLQAFLNPLASPPKYLGSEMDFDRNAVTAQKHQTQKPSLNAGGDDISSRGDGDSDNLSFGEPYYSRTPSYESNPLLWHDGWSHDLFSLRNNPLNRECTELDLWPANLFESAAVNARRIASESPTARV